MEWPVDDQDKALAWKVEEADKCPGCGTQSYEAGMFEVTEITCRTCAGLELRQSDVFETKPPKKPGKKFMLKRRGDGE